MRATTGFPSIEDILRKPIPKPGQVSSSSGSSASDDGGTLDPNSVSGKFQQKMIEIHLKELEAETQRRARQNGVQYISLKGFPINPDALKLIPESRARALNAICFLFTGNDIRIGALNPNSESINALLDELKDKTGAHGAAYMVSDESLKQAMKLYAALPQIKEVTYSVNIKESDIEKYKDAITNFRDLEKVVNSVNITDLTALLIAAAMKINVSDIHIEAEERAIVIRYRIDGVLQQAATISKDRWPKVISRIKLLSGLKLNIDTRPQDGRITIELGEDKLEIRVSTLPTAYGESVVMRLLKSTATSLKFEDLGVRGKAFEDLSREIGRPNGMIITTGPTGSGKTTTLYAILNSLNVPGVKIITLEDPIEYKLPGIAQSQIDASRNYTFAGGLRSILRQDPEIIMVGEIRDLETAETATQAALTGHLVISTIHTNSAAGAIPRFLSMGVQPALLAPALNAIIGQRLIRKLHSCKVPADLPPDVLARVKHQLATISPAAKATIDLDNLHFFAPKGCSECGGSGFKGRLGIYEIFTMSKEIEAEILSGKISEYRVQELAMQQGMVSMLQDGLLKAMDGITSVDEVLEAAERR